MGLGPDSGYHVRVFKLTTKLSELTNDLASVRSFHAPKRKPSMQISLGTKNAALAATARCWLLLPAHLRDECSEAQLHVFCIQTQTLAGRNTGKHQFCCPDVLDRNWGSQIYIFGPQPQGTFPVTIDVVGREVEGATATHFDVTVKP